MAADSYTPIPILKDDRTQNAYGEYSFDFETGNGIARGEQGHQEDGQENSGSWRLILIIRHFLFNIILFKYINKLKIQ